VAINSYSEEEQYALASRKLLLFFHSFLSGSPPSLNFACPANQGGSAIRSRKFLMDLLMIHPTYATMLLFQWSGPLPQELVLFTPMGEVIERQLPLMNYTMPGKLLGSFWGTMTFEIGPYLALFLHLPTKGPSWKPLYLPSSQRKNNPCP
jgi:hypothetical protein